MNNNFDFTKIENYKGNLLLIVDKLLDKFSINHDPVGGFDFDQCSIDTFLEKVNFNLTYDISSAIYNLVRDYTLEVFHCTRAIDKMTFYNYGLRCNTYDNYIKIIKPVLENIGMGQENISKVENKLKREIERKTQNIKPNVCFFYPNNKCTADFISFSDYFGGEIFNSIFRDDYPQECEKVNKISHPFLIKFKVSISDIPPVHHDKLARYIIVQYMLLKFNISEQYGFDSFVNKNIPKSDILDITDLEA